MTRGVPNIEYLPVVPDATRERCTLSLPEKDRPVFAAAQRGKATNLLTRDRRHFGPYMNKPKDTMGVVVQAVGDFLLDVTKSYLPVRIPEIDPCYSFSWKELPFSGGGL